MYDGNVAYGGLENGLVNQIIFVTILDGISISRRILCALGSDIMHETRFFSSRLYTCTDRLATVGIG